MINLEKELDSKIFMIADYNNKEEMELHIKEYMKKIKEEYPSAVITREFYKGSNILVRAIKIENKTVDIKQNNKEREKDDWYIRQRGER